MSCLNAVAAAAPSPEEGALGGPDTDVAELEEEPSGWRTEHTSNLFSTGAFFSSSLEPYKGYVD